MIKLTALTVIGHQLDFANASPYCPSCKKNNNNIAVRVDRRRKDNRVRLNMV